MTLLGNNSQTFIVQPQHILTIVAAAVSSGIVYRLGDSQGEQGSSVTSIAASSTTKFGPYAETTRFDVICDTGEFTITDAMVNLTTEITEEIDSQVLDASPLVLNLPTSDPEVEGALWSDSGTVKVSAGAP